MDLLEQLKKAEIQTFDPAKIPDYKHLIKSSCALNSQVDWQKAGQEFLQSIAPRIFEIVGSNPFSFAVFTQDVSAIPGYISEHLIEYRCYFE